MGQAINSRAGRAVDGLARVRLGTVLTGVVLSLLFASNAALAFGLEDVAKRAEALAAKPYDPGPQVPEVLRELNYDQWRDIRFKTDNALWRDQNLPFEVQFFHAGLYFERPVQINVIREGQAEPVPFSPDLFDYGKNGFEPPLQGGFAGLRIHGPIKGSDYLDEIAVFLGASYFRAVGAPHGYGLSARGIAIDTGAPEGEEFPRFREFWLEQPSERAKSVRLFALLDGPSLAGAYEFVVTPGEETVTEIQSRLYPRKEINKLGVAPLTSMFFYGENRSIRPVDDFRPEVHDSDGLLVAMDSGERVWRPLENPSQLTSNAFMATNPTGFGLMQRDRVFDHYLDLEADYHLRPSAWVEPTHDWGAGHVELVQIPTENEINDNIVAFWVPKEPAQPGQALDFAYRLRWTDQAPGRADLARVSATRTASYDATLSDAPGKLFVVEYAPPERRPASAEGEIKAVVEAGGNGEIVEQQLIQNEETGGWRLVFRVVRKDASGNPIGRLLDNGLPPVELRAHLRRGEQRLTETWSYTLRN